MPAEFAIHPAEANGANELLLMCDDVKAFVVNMSERRVTCSDLRSGKWGLITHLTLPGAWTTRDSESFGERWVRWGSLNPGLPLNPMCFRLRRAGGNPQRVAQLVCQSPHLGGSTYEGENLDAASGHFKFDHRKPRRRSRPV